MLICSSKTISVNISLVLSENLEHQLIVVTEVYLCVFDSSAKVF